jgi:hypothetical protein
LFLYKKCAIDGFKNCPNYVNKCASKHHRWLRIVVLVGLLRYVVVSVGVDGVLLSLRFACFVFLLWLLVRWGYGRMCVSLLVVFISFSFFCCCISALYSFF